MTSNPKTKGRAKRRRRRSPAVPPKKQGKPEQPSPRDCIAPDCGRPAYAGGLCQTHHRQSITTGKLSPIRPYRKRTAGTVKFAGLRITPGCAEQLRKVARRKGLSYGAAIAAVLEGWWAQEQKGTRQRPLS
jgi:hypothetical protein